MRALLVCCLVACSSSSPQPKPEPAKGSATTTSAATLTPGVELPEVTLSGYALADDATPTIAATLGGITVEGKQVVAMQDGLIRPDELDGGAMGLIITKLAVIGDRLERSSRVVLSFDRRIPYRTLAAAIFTLKKSGHRQFGLLARAGAHVIMAPITFPELARVDGSAPDERVAEPRPLEMIVSITKTEATLWSRSKQEGTFEEPKLTVKLADKAAVPDLNRALAEIVARRFPSGTTRGEADRVIVIQADPSLPLQTFAEVVGAVRATPDAKDLFPEVYLSLGFE